MADGVDLSVLGGHVCRLERVEPERVAARFGCRRRDRVDRSVGEVGSAASKCFEAFAKNGNYYSPTIIFEKREREILCEFDAARYCCGHRLREYLPHRYPHVASCAH